MIPHSIDRTAVSHPRRDPSGFRGHLSGVARRSQYRAAMLLSALAGSLTTGCIIPEAPDYGPPHQTPIFIEADSVFPNPYSMQHYINEPGNSAEFRFTFRSEDAGAGLITVFYLDYKHKNGFRIDHGAKSPQSFDKERLISYTEKFIDTNIGKGPECHTFTITVFHDSPTSWNPDTNEQIGTPPDMASVTWYARMNDDGETALAAGCPDTSTESTEPAK